MIAFLTKPTAHNPTPLLIRAPEPRLPLLRVPHALPLAERALLEPLQARGRDRLRLRQSIVQRHELRVEHARELGRGEGERAVGGVHAVYDGCVLAELGGGVGGEAR